MRFVRGSGSPAKEPRPPASRVFGVAIRKANERCARLVDYQSVDAGGRVSFPAFIPHDNRLHEYSEGVFHQDCFARWEDREEYEDLYKQFRSIWETRPRGLKNLTEIEEWGRAAFKNFGKEK
jgi:hypothetical protein